jgi:hypothetical protein
MPKMTVKYSSAVSALKKIELETSGDQELDYQRLIAAGRLWDSKKQEWINLAAEPAGPASPMVRIRVWAEKGKAGFLAEMVKEGLCYYGPYELVDMSAPYPCRPPKQNEERVYLSLVSRKEA